MIMRRAMPVGLLFLPWSLMLRDSSVLMGWLVLDVSRYWLCRTGDPFRCAAKINSIACPVSLWRRSCIHLQPDQPSLSQKAAAWNWSSIIHRLSFHFPFQTPPPLSPPPPPGRQVSPSHCVLASIAASVFCHLLDTTSTFLSQESALLIHSQPFPSVPSFGAVLHPLTYSMNSLVALLARTKEHAAARSRRVESTPHHTPAVLLWSCDNLSRSLWRIRVTFYTSIFNFICFIWISI